MSNQAELKDLYDRLEHSNAAAWTVAGMLLIWIYVIIIGVF